jgi:hypothetical protein
MIIRELVRDEQAVAAVEELIRETEDRLKQIEKPPSGEVKP